MNKQVVINEEQLNVLRESINTKITFFRFFYDVKNYIKELLNGNVKAIPSEILRSFGLTSKRLESYLIKNHIIIKKEDIREVNDGEKMVSMYYITYSVPKKNFKRKIKRLFSKLFEK